MKTLIFDDRSFAISPDGSLLVYAVEEGASSALRLHPMNSGAAVPIRGTKGARQPFFSPDGKWIGFVAGVKLKKVAIAGGAPVALWEGCPYLRGAVWSDDGWIYFVPNMFAPISRIPDGGGQSQPVTKIHTNEKELSHRWPDILPGGKALLHAVRSGGDRDEATIVAEHLDTGERKILVRGGTFPRYLPTGHLIYERARGLYALRFDTRLMKVEGLAGGSGQ